MTTATQVSVIINFLNAEKFLVEAIESVFSQTYDQWELCLVDDGSWDESTRIALEYAAKHPERVRYLEHQNHRNLGMSASRNLGIRHARGQYIALLDADDAWFPQKLKEQIAILEAHPKASMVFGNRMHWKSWTDNSASVDTVSHLGFEADKPMLPPELLRQTFVLRNASTPCPSDLLFRREMWMRIGGFEEQFDKGYQVYEDQAFLAKVFLEEVVIGSNSCWSRYRFHPESAVSVSRKSGDVERAWIFFLKWLEKYLITKNATGTDIWETLQKRLWPYRHPALQRVFDISKRMVKPAVSQRMRDWLRRTE